MNEKPKVAGGATTPFTVTKGLRKARSNEYSIKDHFKYGYRNKEDLSNLPPNTLVIGSQNVLTNAADRVGVRGGYTLDGLPGTQNSYGIDSAYDFLTRLDTRENLRKWGTTLEVRYQNPVGGVDLFTNGTLSGNADGWFTYDDVSIQPIPSNGWVYVSNSLQPSPGAVPVGQNVGITEGTQYRVQFDISGTAGIMELIVNGTSVDFYQAGASYDVFVTAQASIDPFQAGTVTFSPSAPFNGVLSNVSVSIPSTYWIPIKTDLIAANEVNFTNFWDFNTEVKMFCLFVNGDSNVYEWSGGIGSFESATVDTVTISGTKTTSQLGFYDNAGNSAKFILLINGVEYTYTDVSGETFTGVSPSPIAAGVVGDAVIQKPATTSGGDITTNGSGNLSGFTFDLIAVLENQIWYGDETNTVLYVSKTNNYKDVTFSTPARLPAEGALITLDSYPVGFSPQSSQMYITAGSDQWWISLKTPQTIDISGVATPTETLSAQRLKTALNQAAQEQALIGKYKNSLIFVSNEQIINALGLVQNIQVDPQVTNMSDPIKYDVDAYDFSGGQVLYDNYFIYVSVPIEGIVRMYNIVKQYWEAPQTIPVSRFYHTTQTTGSVIYGHSSTTNESYLLFTGNNDNGNPVNAVAAFPYISSEGGSFSELKSFNKIYTEGYISENTTLMVTINYDFGGFSGTYTTLINGADANIIFNRVTDGSLGQNSLGSQPIGSILNLPNNTNLPKFRVINTMPRVDCFEYQIVFSTDDIDYNWEILRFGNAIAASSNIPTFITE